MAILEFGKLMIKNLFSKPVTTSYPAEPYEYPERSRGHIEIDIDKCISCTICAQNCPPGALKVDRQKGTWTIDRFDCIACGYCVTKCPKKCLTMVPGYQEPMGAKSEEVYQRPAESMVKPAPKKPAAPAKDAAPKAAAAPAMSADGEHVAIDIDKCISCTLCAKNCPAEALTVDRKEGTWVIDRSACITCGLCVTKCPKKCLSMENGGISEGTETFRRSPESMVKPAAKKAEPAKAEAPAKEAVKKPAPIINDPVVVEENGEHVSVKINDCISCGVCVNACPGQALTVDGDEGTWVIDRSRCIACGICTVKCPNQCLDMENGAIFSGIQTFKRS